MSGPGDPEPGKEQEGKRPAARERKPILLRTLPLLILLPLLVLLGIGLGLDPREVPSPLVGKPAPAFSLARLHEPEAQFSTSDMAGEPWILNVWASWCTGCYEEHRFLMQIKDEIPMVGLNYKDEAEDAKRFLAEQGDPFTHRVVDPEGLTGLDYGVYGLPETFVIDRNGVIRYKHIGPLDREAVETEVIPLIRSLRQEA